MSHERLLTIHDEELLQHIRSMESRHLRLLEILETLSLSQGELIVKTAAELKASTDALTAAVASLQTRIANPIPDEAVDAVNAATAALNAIDPAAPPADTTNPT